MNRLKPPGFLFKSGQIEPDLGMLNAVRKRLCIETGGTFQNYVGVLARQKGQHHSERALANDR